MSIDKTLEERGARYGDFSDHAKIAQEIQDAMRAAPGWARLNPAQKQALSVIADKQARILSGDPDYADNWHDIQGYARLVEERLPSVPVAANDNIPSGFKPWNPHAGEVPPPAGLVVEAVRRDGTILSGRSANHWGALPHNPSGEIIGYKLHG
ncbi:hypothetical protein [Pseudomonas phage PPpW-3]|uniref:Uncharacterized protein n=1 Tax=Pseudomonas phage PPpW-3 TaxID=1279082 RepID=V5YTP3_9CAUD|nr:hypothetical protein X916_gp29 [Pseudomonas phage PPpW-3]BAO20629.1 hypothetical protein [Pseudomonas phage PPpW-3]